ncbi:hypothetical protein BC834DRAFT_878455 [Gloeopeniophorella convolvens]|nr:hypothetical protein BC834DRAFT_878455 [Gloeopeniophorella convolvens]
MSTSLQAEGLCFRFPENLPPHPSLSQEMAVQMLSRAVGLATQIAFQPSYIDKPPDGQIYLLFVPGGVNFPIDGVRYMENEQRYTMPAGGGRELEVIEARSGFVPLSGEMVASRVRRRFRLLKGGHPFLTLVHYSRGQSIPVPPALQAQPVRQYPLRPHNEQAAFVLGERQGQRVPASGGVGGMPPAMAVGGRPDAQAMLAQQNREMEALERRTQRERSASMNPIPLQRQQQPQMRPDEEDSADELEHISTRTLALTRYGRNHELMNEVFMHAAFGGKHPTNPPAPYSVFDKAELESRVVRTCLVAGTLRKLTHLQRKTLPKKLRICEPDQRPARPRESKDSALT